MSNKTINYYFAVLKNLIIFLIVIILCAIILIKPQVTSIGVKNGFNYCLNILIPSLFPFMFLTVFTVRYGISETLSKIFSPFVKLFFKLPECVGSTILMGLIGGYPAGAVGINELYKQKKISRSQAEQMLLFTIGAGPAFVLSTIGSQLSNSFIGIIIFVSQIISSIILGILISFFYKENSNINNNNFKIKKFESISESIIDSSLTAAKSVFNLCTFVVLFSAFINIFNYFQVSNILRNIFIEILIPESILNTIIPIIFEVTNGCISIIQNHAPIELIPFALSWAGLCVHFQIFSITKSIFFSKSKFILCRFLHAIISIIITHLLFILIPNYKTYPVIKEIYSTNKSTAYLSKASIVIIILNLFFLCILVYRKSYSRSTNRRFKFERNKKRRIKNFFKK